MGVNTVDRPLASVVHADSPSKFFIRLQHNDVVYDELKRNIQLALGVNQRSKKSTIKFNETDIYTIKHVGIWKRATVSSYDKGLVCAFLIDEGLKITCSEGDVYLLEKNFTDCPPTVKRCHLSDVIAQDKNPDNWPEEATSYFRKEVKSRLTVKIWIRGEERTMPDGSLSTPVDITFDEKIRDGPLHPLRVIERTMSQLLLREKFAQYAVPPSDVTLIMSAPIEDEEMSMITEHQETAEVTIDGGDVVKSWLPPVIPRKKRFRARPTHVDGMGQIYIQRCEDQSLVHEMRHRFVSDFGDKEAAELDDPNIREDWKIGDECIAMFKEDACWYRGRVHRVEKTTRKCGVFFVDFGSTESVPFCLIRTARRFAQYPMLAFRVILENVLPLSGQPMEMEWPDNVLDKIYTSLILNTSGVVVTVKMNRHQLPLLVKIEKIGRNSEDSKVYVDFNEGIVETGFARRGKLRITNELQKNFSKLGLNIEAVPESENGSSISSVAVNPFTDHNWCKYIGERIRISVPSVLEFPRLCIYYEEAPYTSHGMEALVQKAARNGPPVIRPQLSMPVLARYKKMWYRAYVRHIDEDDKVTVCYVDFQAIAECSVLRNIPADILAIPVFSPVVSLPYKSDVPKEAMAELVDLVKHVHGPLYLEVHSFNESEQVIVGDIWIQDDEEEKLLYQELISRGVLY